MTDHPIIFSAAMIAALLAGRKTMTRRKAWRVTEIDRGLTDDTLGSGPRERVIAYEHRPTMWQKVRPGDRLWCREAWWHYRSSEIEQAGFPGGTVTLLDRGPARFHANADFDPADYPRVWRKRSPIYMPRWASRLTLVVTEARAERLQAITAAGAIAEGCRPHANSQTIDCDTPDPRDDFARLWDSLHGKGAWERNEEVVALRFEVHHRNIDRLEQAV